MGKLMLYDLTAAVAELNSLHPLVRMDEAAKVLPDVGIVALNGIPFVQDPVELTYFNATASMATIREQVLLGLGFGGVLTFMNQGAHSLETLAEISLDEGHDWAMHSINLTLCFAGAPTFVELSFARDRRFHMSWVEPKARTDWTVPRVFTATGSLKTWKKYLKNRDSPDFLNTQRRWMGFAHKVLSPVLPEYFGEGEQL